MIKIKLKLRKENQINKKRGAAVAETILLTAVSLVLVVMVFYPTIRDLLNQMLVSLNNWFVNSMSMIGI